MLGRLLLLAAAAASAASASAAHNESVGNATHVGHVGIHVASLKFAYVAVPLLLSAFIMAVVVVKIAFEHVHWLSHVVPESCLLIVLGLALGCFFLLDSKDTFKLLVFNPDTFFLYLLPPIILEAAYSLRDRAFAENFGTIILYAVVGTLLNWAAIGLVLFGIVSLGGMGALSISALDCLIFAALISAVDPVAVLAIFQELGVNKMLYFMVFGESLLNDAVTVVLYTVLVTFSRMETITASDIGLGVAAFLASSFGAIVIGTVLGLLTGFITKYTGKLRVVEPTTLFGMAYLAYLAAELFHFSGIISIICCGLVQSHFAMENISSKSYVTVHYFSKVLSSVTESLIFIILGLMLVNDHAYWQGWSTPFTVYALAVVIVTRFAGVFLLTKIVNIFTAGVRKISTSEQLIMSYGGLRGAVSFSLVFMLTKDEVRSRDTLMCATYVIILFTVFVQGSTIGPLVRLLSIQLEDKDITMFGEINRNVVDNMTTGIEEITGHHGVQFWAAMSQYLSRRFLRPILQKAPSSKGKNLLNTYAEVNIQSKLSRANSAAMHLSNSTVWDELQLVDASSLNPSMAEFMLDAQDDAYRGEAKEARRKARSADKGEVPHSIRDLRHLLASPLHKSIHYRAGDRNLKADVSEGQRQKMNHLLDTRRKSLKRFGGSLKVPKNSSALLRERRRSLGKIHEEEATEETAFLTPTETPEHLPVKFTIDGPRNTPPPSKNDEL